MKPYITDDGGMPQSKSTPLTSFLVRHAQAIA